MEDRITVRQPNNESVLKQQVLSDNLRLFKDILIAEQAVMHSNIFQKKTTAIPCSLQSQ